MSWVARDLFVGTKRTNLTTEQGSSVTEHEITLPATRPEEWSFSMLRDAALAVLEANEIGRNFGLQSNEDAGFTVVFHDGRPKLADVAGFIPISDELEARHRGWRAFGTYQRSFLMPLSLWSRGDADLARRCISGPPPSMTDYWRNRHPWARALPQSLLRKYEYAYTRYRGVNTWPRSELRRRSSTTTRRHRLGALVTLLSSRTRRLPLSGVDIQRLKQRTLRLKPPMQSTRWSEYHRGSAKTERHERVLEIIEQSEASTVLDLAGNAGFLSLLIAGLHGVDRVVCVDYDEGAIERLYGLTKASRAPKVVPVLASLKRQSRAIVGSPQAHGFDRTPCWPWR